MHDSTSEYSRKTRPCSWLPTGIAVCCLCVILAGCAPLPAPASPAPTALPTLGTPQPQTRPTQCRLTSITPPVMPAEIPGYTQLDPATGLHMTGTVQQIDLAGYLLKVTGKVDHPLSLTYDELRCMPRVECAACTLVCPGFFTDHATWAGASLASALRLAGVQPDARQVVLRSADGYAPAIPLDQALADENILAYELEGQPIPILHGFPVRVVLPSQTGGLWVKWLVEITVE